LTNQQRPLGYTEKLYFSYLKDFNIKGWVMEWCHEESDNISPKYHFVETPYLTKYCGRQNKELPVDPE